LSFIKQAFKGVLWLTSFRILQQIIAWATTIIVARILLPKDYGFMEMATGYVALFSELGLGVAIIQKKSPKTNFPVLFGLLFFWHFSCVYLFFTSISYSYFI